jgi:hypothetical protein
MRLLWYTFPPSRRAFTFSDHSPRYLEEQVFHHFISYYFANFFDATLQQVLGSHFFMHPGVQQSFHLCHYYNL